MGDHLQDVFDYVVGDDSSEMAKIKAEHAYALHALEREIAICAKTQKQNDALVKAIQDIKQATINGRVCDDVAWFDTITTLHDFCDQVLASVGTPGDSQ